MGFSARQRSARQEIIDGYLNDTGRNMLVPGEFLEWLSGKPDHPAYGLFFGQTDEQAALEHRKELVRKWVSGLRIKVTASEKVGRSVRVVEREYPAMISPMASRANGGGYVNTDIDDPAHIADMRDQAATALESWLDRYGGIAADTLGDTGAISGVIEALRGDEKEAAA